MKSIKRNDDGTIKSRTVRVQRFEISIKTLRDKCMYIDSSVIKSIRKIIFDCQQNTKSMRMKFIIPAHNRVVLSRSENCTGNKKIKN